MENILTGFKRHFIERLRSLSGTPSSIAGGAAVGVMVSFTPFVGLHTLLAVVLAWALRFNVLAAGNRYDCGQSLDVSVYLGRGLLYRADYAGGKFRHVAACEL